MLSFTFCSDVSANAVGEIFILGDIISKFVKQALENALEPISVSFFAFKKLNSSSFVSENAFKSIVSRFEPSGTSTFFKSEKANADSPISLRFLGSVISLKIDVEKKRAHKYSPKFQANLQIEVCDILKRCAYLLI